MEVLWGDVVGVYHMVLLLSTTCFCCCLPHGALGLVFVHLVDQLFVLFLKKRRIVNHIIFIKITSYGFLMGGREGGREVHLYGVTFELHGGRELSSGQAEVPWSYHKLVNLDR